ncbi:MAG: hypothetical protein V8T62_00495 [Oscillospiraceae bacterium]
MKNHPAETLTRRKKSFVPLLARRRIRSEKNNLKGSEKSRMPFYTWLYHLGFCLP